jgi:prepilin-type N-terminal cleavage/methylation domain-containing protein
MKTRRAFSLVELLVALSVTAVIVVAMLRLFMDGTTLWQRNDEKLDTFREARAALQVMARDLAGLRPVPPDAPTDFPDDFPMLMLDHHPDSDAQDEGNQELYALAAIRNQGRSDLCAVGYYCAWDQTKKAYVLKRQFTESNKTFELLKDALPAGAPLNGTQAFKTIYSRSLASNVQSIDDLASYIWDVQVEIPEMGDPPVQEDWPQGAFNRELPLWVEVRMKALGTNAGRKLAGQQITRDTWFQPESALYRNLILPGQQELVTRIKLCR